MNDNVKIILSSISDVELNKMYGGHLRYNVNDCFKTNDGHYYMQRTNDVLHLKDDNLINLIHNSVLDKNNLIKISNEEFTDQLKITIFNLGILYALKM